MGRILGVDHGERRIGLAISDPDGVLASPLETVDVRGGDPAAAVARVCEQQGAERVVVGLPLHLNAQEGASAEKARAFAEALRARTCLPVELWDERLTTVTAQKALIEGGVRRKRRKELVDGLAARILLQHYLDSRPAAMPDPGEEP